MIETKTYYETNGYPFFSVNEVNEFITSSRRYFDKKEDALKAALEELEATQKMLENRHSEFLKELGYKI